MNRLITNVVCALALLAAPVSFADDSEKCAVKAVNANLKAAKTLFKPGAKVCKSLDDGAEAAFDDPPNGDDDGNVDPEEVAGVDVDFEKVAEKINKFVDKTNAIVADGGAECEAHFPGTTFPTETIEAIDVQNTVAAFLDQYCL